MYAKKILYPFICLLLFIFWLSFLLSFPVCFLLPLAAASFHFLFPSCFLQIFMLLCTIYYFLLFWCFYSFYIASAVCFLFAVFFLHLSISWFVLLRSASLHPNLPNNQYFIEMQASQSVFITFTTYKSLTLMILWSTLWCWPSQFFLSCQNSFNLASQKK